MKKKTQRLIVILLAVAMLLTIIVPALSILASADVTKSDIDKIKGELSEVAAQRKEADAKLAAIRDDMAKAEEQVELVQEQILLTEQQIGESQALLDAYDAQIAEREEELLALQAQEEEQYQEFYRQVRWMEETGSVSYLAILFEASSFSEMLDYAMVLGDIMEYSNRIIERLEATQAAIVETQAQIQADRDEQAKAQAELEAYKSELEDKKAEATKLLNEIAESESEYAETARQLAAEEAEIDKSLRDAERQYQKQLEEIERRRKEEEERRRQEQLAQQGNNGTNSSGSANVTTGSWYWPLPGRYTLTSRFGGRIGPLTGRWESHTGNDIPAPSGTPIYAANDGIVTTVGTNRYASYGYYCIINHGGGYSTLYAHQCKVPDLTVGQAVSKGEVIGYVGTTGSSTGNHLHFELRINGTRADVLKLYPGMTFKYEGTTVNGG